MKIKKLNKKGFSLVEVIIAMAVVTIVTLTAISIIYSGADHTREGNAQSRALYFVADAIEAFKAAEPDQLGNHSDFYNALMMTGKDASGNIVYRDDVTPIVPPSGFTYAFQINGSNCRVYIKFSSPKPGAYNGIEIEARDSKDNIIDNFSYEKSPR